MPLYWHQFHQPLMGQALQRLADHRAADTKGLRQRILLKRRARCNAMVDDRFVEVLVHTFIRNTRPFRGLAHLTNLC